MNPLQELTDLGITIEDVEEISRHKDKVLKELSSRPWTVSELVSEFYRRIDNASAASVAKNNHKPSCKKGCAFCCHIKVTAMEIEVMHILKYCSENNIKFTPEKIERLKLQAKTDDTVLYMMSPYKKCVFLSEQNECTIYEVRPSACRSHLVVSDPKHCDTDVNPEDSTASVKSLEVYGITLAMMSIDDKGPENFAELLLRFINRKRD